MKIDRPNLDEDLSEALVSSLYDIASDAERYDGGDMYAIKRSAITLRSLFHDTKYSHGLIQQLNLQKSMKFASFSKNYDKYKSAISFNRLIFARFKINNNVLIKNPFYDTLIFYPGDSGPDSYLTFDEWWNQPLITFKDNNTNDSISRRDLILKEANQDGPAHFDKKVDNLYLKYRILLHL